jgi:cytidylate kinase
VVEARRRAACVKLPRTIAIDGPSAAGKSSVGYRVAQRLGYPFLDTGAMYRALTWLALQRGVDIEDAQALGHLARQVDVRLAPPLPGSPERCTIWVDGEDLTLMLRRPEVEAAVSLVSRAPALRRAMVDIQRRLARRGPLVMAGRDIGTVVLPKAELKIYLDASMEERVRRRRKEMASLGREVSVAEVRRNIVHRDSIDSSRKTAPLRPAADATIIDTDDMSEEQVVERVMALAEAKAC